MGIHPREIELRVPESTEKVLCSDTPVHVARLMALNKSLLSKWHGGGTTSKADEAALSLFREVNARAQSYKIDETSYYYDLLIKARDIIRTCLEGELQSPKVSLAKAIDRLRPGPGSSLGTKSTDFLGKLFFSKLSCYDPMLHRYYVQTLSPRWLSAENLRRSKFGDCSVVPCSRMTFAAKNAEISRVINTEASVEMLFQLGVGELLNDCLKEEFNISLSKQPDINRCLAKIGSIDGSFATIDLKSASDLNSTTLVKFLLPPQVFQCLDGLRAKCIELPDGDELELGMFSTMGNGFTFPLQTLIFASLVKAVYVSMGLPTDNRDFPHFSVFGDDIICTKHAYNTVCNLLEFAGHTVNKLKSYNSGCFRESCGRDYFKGHNIRGVYLKELNNETHVYSAFNRLSRWSAVSGVDLSGVLSYLKGLAVFRPVPFDEHDASGFKIPEQLLPYVKVTKSGAIRYNGMIPRARQLDTYKTYSCNPHACVIALMGGYIRNGFTILRSRTVKFVPKWKSTPSWDWIPHKGLTIPDYMIALAGTM